MVERKGETNFFTLQNIKDCMKKVIAVNIHQTLKLCDGEIEVTAYYAGHVLGAAMFHVKVYSSSGGAPTSSTSFYPGYSDSRGHSVSCLYTGDYNMTPDRHLGAAQISKLKVDLLITETTYATTIRDSKRLREREFLARVHKTVEEGGKVLIPVFALGRAQELCILIETYWERMGLGEKVPIFFSAGLVEKANLYYKLFINWTNQKIKETFVKHNMFDFKHIKPFDRSFADKPGPMVLFATPGMLHAGTSLEIFKKWCSSELNMCILPGYCVAGTVGNKILSGSKRVEIDKRLTVDVKLKVKSLSFSAHADAKGIMQLIQQCEPKNVMLVHGEKGKMQFLKDRIHKEFGIPCFDPANGEVLTINLYPSIPIDIERSLLRRCDEDDKNTFSDPFDSQLEPIAVKKPKLDHTSDIEALLVVDSSSTVHRGALEEEKVQNGKSPSTASSSAPSIKLVHLDNALEETGLQEHTLSFESEHFLGQISSDDFWTSLANNVPPQLLSIDNDKRRIFRFRSIEMKEISEPENSIKISWDFPVRITDPSDFEKCLIPTNLRFTNS